MWFGIACAITIVVLIIVICMAVLLSIVRKSNQHKQNITNIASLSNTVSEKTNVETKGKDVGNETKEKDLNGIRVWLDSIGFAQYFDLFALNGFDSMDFVKEIKLASELNYIGITTKEHQRAIM